MLIVKLNMKDVRITKLAGLLLDYSIGIKKGDNLYIEWKGQSTLSLISELIAQTVRRGAVPFWFYHDEKLLRPLIEGAGVEQMKTYSSVHCGLMKRAQCYIGINGSDNPFEMASLSLKQSDDFTRYFSKPVHTEIRSANTRWCVLRWPSLAMAQMANMSHQEFIEFYFETCLVDYKKMSREMDGLVRIIEKADKVRIVAPDTDLKFSVRGVPVKKCDGHMNIPDGEIFTAPVRESVNGTIRFNAPALHRGMVFTNIKMEFKDGRAVKVTCDGDSKALNSILDIDPGARFIGEFAVGVNPKIKRPMKDGLFDEKIDGSVHFALGSCYDEVPNKNKSAIHWDIILIQTPEWGGGEIYFDGKLVRKDGKFV
jgi:aminopeptidase